jgi:hypothetical protein
VEIDNFHHVPAEPQEQAGKADPNPRSKAAQLSRLRQRLETSMKWREQEGYDQLWRRLVDMYAGRQFPEAKSKEDRIAVNLAWATINIIYPTVSVNRPNTTVLARDAGDQERALIAEATVNQWWEQLDILPEFRLAVKDFLIMGHGWAKVGWEYEEEEVDRKPEDIEADFEAARAQADEMAAMDPEAAGDLPDDETLVGTIPMTETVVVKDQPFVERVSPHDIFVDPDATKLSDMAWIAQRIVRPLEDVRNDKRYNARARNKATADRSTNRSWLKRKSEEYGDDIQRVTVWEFYDLKKREVSVFAHAGEGFLVDPTPIPYVHGHPFVQLRNYDVPDHFYPMGDLESMEPLQDELNKTRSQLMNTRKQFIRKYLVRGEAFDARGRAAMASDVDGEVIEVNGAQFNLNEVVMPMPTVTIPPELYNHSAQTEADINTVTGVTEYQRGSAPGVRRTATEAAIIQDSVNARSAEKLSIVERAIGEISKRLIELANQFATQGGPIRKMGPNGTKTFAWWEPSDFDADMDFVVEPSSTVPKGEDYRRQQAMQLMQAIGPFIGPMGSGAPLDGAKVAAWLLEQFGIADVGRFMAPPPMPMMGMPGMVPPGAPGDPSQASPHPEGEGHGPGPENNPMAQDPELAAQLGAAGGPAGAMGDPSAIQGVPPEVLAQLAGQTGLNIPM